MTITRSLECIFTFLFSEFGPELLQPAFLFFYAFSLHGLCQSPGKRRRRTTLSSLVDAAFL